MIGHKWNKNFTICAGGAQAHKRSVTCFGDSGGPVLVYRKDRWFLIGIISFAHDIKEEHSNKRKCNASMPFYFVKVRAYYEWIHLKSEAALDAFQ